MRKYLLIIINSYEKAEGAYFALIRNRRISKLFSRQQLHRPSQEPVRYSLQCAEDRRKPHLSLPERERFPQGRKHPPQGTPTGF